MPTPFHGRTTTQVAINAASASVDLVAAPGTGLKVYVVALAFSVDTAATTVKFTEGTGPTDITGVMEFVDGGGMINSGVEPILQTNTANSKLSIVAAGGAVRGWLRYYIAA